MKNILVTSAGRRVELVQEFQTVLKSFDLPHSVFCADLMPKLSAACLVADKYFQVPSASDKQYPSALLDICLDHNIGLIVPTIDTELQVLSDNRERFKHHGVEVLISAPQLIRACRDKRLTTEIYEKIGISYPRLYDKNYLRFPLFCKPYDGSCSIGVKTIYSETDLTPEILANDKNMYMELVGSEYIEYTCDAYFNLDSELCCLVPRERLEVRAGEVSKGITRKGYVYEHLLKRIGKLEGAIGCITFQVFGNPSTGEIRALEINPRFGGGYPLTSASGATFVEWIVREFLMDQRVTFYESWKNNLCMLRYDAKVLTVLGES
jgi:carbamoyl-phosphate synthase large subunit